MIRQLRNLGYRIELPNPQASQAQAQCFSTLINALACPNPKVKETLVLESPRSRAILGSLDILVDIGVPAEKEVIQ
jgi:hypothetical protein